MRVVDSQSREQLVSAIIIRFIRAVIDWAPLLLPTLLLLAAALAATTGRLIVEF